MTVTPRRHVLHLLKGLDAGGAESLVVLASRHRDRDRFSHEVAYLVPDHAALAPDLAEEGVTTTCLTGVPWWDPRWLHRLRRILRQRPADVVHAHSPLVAGGARLVVRSLPRRARPRMVVTLHNVWASHHPAARALDRATHGLDDLRISVSEAARRSLPGRMGEDVGTVVHGIDVDPLRDRADRSAARRELGVADDDLVVGTVANPSPAKCYPDLLEAAVIVAESCATVRFVAVGEGPMRAELERQRDATGLRGRFRFLGHRPDAARLIAGFDVFCLASRHEGLPLALMEALALGVPVVVTDVGGMSELISQGREGALVPPGRPDLLAEALVAELGDDERRSAHASAAWATGSGLDAQRAVAEVEALYEEVLTRP